MPRMYSFLNLIGSSRSRSNGTAGQGAGWCILLAAMQVSYVHTALEHQFFFLVVYGESGLVRLTLLRRNDKHC